MQGLKDHYFRLISNKLLNGFESQHINKWSLGVPKLPLVKILAALC